MGFINLFHAKPPDGELIYNVLFQTPHATNLKAPCCHGVCV